MSSSAAIADDTDKSTNKEANATPAADTHGGPASDDPTMEHVSATETQSTTQRNTDTSPGIPAAGDSGSGEGARDEKQARATPKHPNGIKQARRDKRKAGWERKKALAKEAKKAKREQREEAMRKAGIEIPQTGKLWRDLPPEQWSVSQRIRMAKKKEFEDLARGGGYRVCVDMAFEHLMLKKARASTVQQILYLYGRNRKATQPCLVTLSGMGDGMTAAISRLAGFDTWLGFTTESRCYTEIFKKEELVYLTADSPNTLTQLETEKVYVIGGIVDRNAHKGLCFKKATDQGIATARLPLKKDDLNSSASKVLAVNHVFDILVKAMESGGDLQKIEHQTLPPRKRAGWTGGGDNNRESNQDESAKTSSEQGAEGEQPNRGGNQEEHRGSNAAEDTASNSGGGILVDGGEKAESGGTSAVEDTASNSGVENIVDGGEKPESRGSDTKSVDDGDGGKTSC